MYKKDVAVEGLRSFRSLSVDEGGTSKFLIREREESIDLPCEGFPDHLEDQHPQLIKSGWLDKTPPKGGRRFQRRWVMLDGEYLRYFQNNKEVYSKRMVALACVSGVARVGEQRFEIITKGRTFLFRAPNSKQRDDWLSCLWKVLESRQENRCGNGVYKTGSVSIEGYLEMTSPRTKLYTILKDQKIFLFRNQEEYLQGIGITDIDMSRANVKQTNKFISISTPYRKFSFVVDSDVERERWLTCLMACVSQSSSDGVCERVWRLESNRVCADCGAAMPEWASVNLCVLVCEQCAGVHQCLGQSVSKVYNLKTDESVWTEDLIKVFLLIGNSKANLFWALHLPAYESLNMKASMSERVTHITAKYQQRKYSKRHTLSGQQEALNNALCIAVQTDDLLESLTLLFSGADVCCSTGIPEFPSPLALANHAGQTAQVELLQQHLAGPVRSEVCHTPVHSHKGHLAKIASSARPITDHKPRADFSQRWCCLDNGVFSYYKTEQSTSRCSCIKTSDIICLSVNSPGNHGYEHTFELFTDSGRVYLFGADDIKTMKEWIKAIAAAMLPAVLRDDSGLYDRLGRLRCAEGSSGIGWFCLSGSRLQFILLDSVQTVDLRKLLTVTLCDGVGDMVLGWRGGSLHLLADRRPHFPGWVQCIQLRAGTGDQPLHLQQLSESGIPITVDRCLDHITRHGLLSVGIYRKCGVNSRVSTLLDDFLRDARSVCVPEHFVVDDVANTLKRFLREVKEGVFNGTQNSHIWLSATGLRECDKVSAYQALLSELPEVNRETLKALLNHLYCVQNFSSMNHMTTRNLGIVFGPTLFQTGGADSRTSKVVEDLILGYCAIFNTSETELQKQMDATFHILNKVKDQACVRRVPSHTVCAVYLEKREQDAELLVQVGVSITVEELVLEVLKIRRIQPAHGEFWRCYEVKEEIERELHYKEEVLPVYYSLSPQSHLLVKRSHYTSDINKYLNGKEEVCKLGTLHVCEVKGSKAKGFSSRHCELSGSTFRLYRELQGSQCEKEWPVQEIKVYQGYRSKLQPPTPWGLTMFHEQRQWYLCCGTEDELIEWMATIMSLQHGEDLG
ncbi:arf-GAP with Rho-GAP domain, ANK repeat and PH domain-containing protein 1 isoform X2 [Brachyhypopomus gauderio]|uniref:arf-GAP with Rho-GAP domain, ANK repeat and PH domain-containing protein 1 isoform X2 n=1 Tax=Brachyhypopomus gauderio TaxID=698409 RepID=UPI004041EAE6